MNEFIVERPVKRGFDTIAELYEMIGDRGFISGSYAAWMCGGFDFTPNDIDIFATSDDNAESIFDDCYSHFHMWYSARTSVARSLSPYTNSGLQYPLQIVNPNPLWSIFPSDIVESFDMNVSRAVLISPTHLLADRDIGQACAKFLLINDPLRSLKRALKYGSRGFDFADTELIKLFMCWDAMNDAQRDTIIQRTYGANGVSAGLDEESENDDFWGGYNQSEDDYFDGE